MKKSNLFLSVIVVMLLALAFGCGDKEAEPTTDLTSVPAEEIPAEEPEAEAPAEVASEPAVPETPVETPETPAEETPEAEAPAEEPAAEDANTTEEPEAEAPAEVDETPEEPTAQNFRIISLKDLHAYPDDLQITVGTTVEWQNVNDKFQHIIGWSGQTQAGVKPEPIKQGESWSYTFNTPGVIKWFSTARPTIQGKITVTE